MLMREDSHLAAKALNSSIRCSPFIAWCIAGLLAFLMTLPLVHASAHQESEAVAGLNSSSTTPIPDHHGDDDSETCAECLVLVFGKHHGTGIPSSWAQEFFGEFGIAAEIAAESPFVIRHTMPPPSRGPPILM